MNITVTSTSHVVCISPVIRQFQINHLFNGLIGRQDEINLNINYLMNYLSILPQYTMQSFVQRNNSILGSSIQR